MGISEDACGDCYKLYIKKICEEQS
jgi:hypothetical protein